MKEIILEGVICAVAAGVLMILHELAKAMVYMGIQRHLGSKRRYSHSIWEVHRYLDPVGIILSITSSVTFSRPFMFRIQSKKVNRILGITGFAVLLFLRQHGGTQVTYSGGVRHDDSGGAWTVSKAGNPVYPVYCHIKSGDVSC